MRIGLYARLGGGRSRRFGKMILKDVREVASSAELPKYGLVPERMKMGNFFELRPTSGMILQKARFLRKRRPLLIPAELEFGGVSSARQKGKLLAYSNASSLVTADWVKDNLNNPKVRIFEVSVDPGVYARAHIPGAINLDWHVDLADTVNRDIASRDKFEKCLRKAGVTKDTTIIIYGDHNN